MSDDTIRLVTVGRMIRRRRRLLTLLAVLGALTGYGTSLLVPPRYTTSASVLLPGAWEERELLTQAQVATSSVVLDRVAAALGRSGPDAGGLRERVRAEAADGNIIKVSGTAGTPEGAQRLSDLVAQEFVAFATKIVGDDADPEAAARLQALRQTVAQTGRRITQLAEAAGPGKSVESVQTRTELAKLHTSLQEAMDKLEQAAPAAGKANMVVMGAAARPRGEAPPTRPQLVAAGALLFFLCAVVGHLAAARMGRRLRTEPEIAAALGATPLGTVDVPGGPSWPRHEDRGPRAGIRRLLGLDVRWDVEVPYASGDETGRLVRYRRVWARLQNLLPGPGRLLVVVADGDAVARRAAGQLAAEAARVSPGSRHSPEAPDAPDSPDSRVSPAGGETVLRVVEVSVDRPMVPDRADESGALVVLSAGSWTAGELSAIAEACADAGHEVVGVVLAGLVRTRPARSGGRTRKSAAPARPAPDGATDGAPEVAR
ncbi:Wzz/FepE/Etk N-terminal domain-containing protein [Streptomyces sp. NPDC058052]|uniref:Wzz/FepE/Etk N-terminal domain-containing protein n=1 Tax=Streptomyces sp. NPDC058052 TaxID=3346316 RepID=UPI0036E3C118